MPRVRFGCNLLQSQTATIPCTGTTSQQSKTVKPLLFLANVFINTFGITQPTEAAANRAARFIASLIGVVLLIFFLAVAFGIYYIARN